MTAFELERRLQKGEAECGKLLLILLRVVD
jgi:hypothetical protein